MNKVEKMRRALMRSNTRLLLSGVLIFQALAMALLAFKDGAVSVQALVLAAALPLVTLLAVNGMGRLWPVDRAVLILVMLLVSIGVITLSAIARSESTPRTQAVYAGIGLAAMFIGAAFVRAWKHWKKFAVPLAALCLLALASPWVLGSWYQGARNWITIVPDRLTLQPSEFMKPVLVVVLAAGFANRPRFVKCLPAIGFAAACCAVLLSERDLGAVLLYFLTTVLMYYAATSNALLTLAGLGMGCAAAVIAYHAFP